MKVLQINVLSDTGSTGKIVRDLDRVLTNKGIDSIICYGRKNTPYPDRTFKFCYEPEAAFQKILNRCGLTLMYGGNILSTNRLIKKIKFEQPDIVHIHCINGYCVNVYQLLAFLADSKINTVVTHHAEFFYTGSCGHAFDCQHFYDGSECRICPLSRMSPENSNHSFPHKSWLRLYDAFHRFQPGFLHFSAVSPWVRERSSFSRIVKDFPCSTVMNGIDTSIFYRHKDLKSIEEHLPKHTKLIFHATASFTDKPSLKGGHYVIELARMMPEYLFVVAASFSDISGKLPTNIKLWGRTNGQKELAKLYSAADVTILTSRKETFSMIVAESLCCGTPVVGFKAGGPESISIKEYSKFVDYGNLALLKKTVEAILKSSPNKSMIANKAQKNYSKDIMADKYLSIYKSMLSR